MDTQFITDNQGNKTATIVPFEKWEWMGEKKEIFEHVYMAGIIARTIQINPIKRI